MIVTTSQTSRMRAYGKARIDIARRAKSREDWAQLWKPPAHPFPFQWGRHWKQCIEYQVDDYPAEVGFYIDVLGFPVNAFDPEYAQFTSPEGDFYIAVLPVQPGGKATPPDAIRLQFMVADIQAAAAELERRGVVFERKPEPCFEESRLHIGAFRSPNGMCLELWGEVNPQPKIQVRPAAERPSFIQKRATP
jgi:catechol 2,3-dioxygenase-like lactoylglutathione lyase family enzyme